MDVRHVPGQKRITSTPVYESIADIRQVLAVNNIPQSPVVVIRMDNSPIHVGNRTVQYAQSESHIEPGVIPPSNISERQLEQLNKYHQQHSIQFRPQMIHPAQIRTNNRTIPLPSLRELGLFRQVIYRS
jgi:hypothetical protein